MPHGAAFINFVVKGMIMAKGTVKWFNATKGYGFIAPEDGAKDAFVHISAVERAGLSGLQDGQQRDFASDDGTTFVVAGDELEGFEDLTAVEAVLEVETEDPSALVIALEPNPIDPDALEATLDPIAETTGTEPIDSTLTVETTQDPIVTATTVEPVVSDPNSSIVTVKAAMVTGERVKE